MKSSFVCLFFALMLSGIVCFVIVGSPPSPGSDVVQFQGKPLDFWVRQLKDDDALAREEAVAVLADAGPDAAVVLPALNDFLKGPASNLRLQAAVAVWKIGRQGDAATPVLVETLKSSNRNDRLTALRILARIGAAEKEVLPAILAILADPDAVVRLRAFQALEQVGSPAVPGLLERLRDGAPGVRKECAACLGRMGADDKDIPARLTDALKDDDKQVGAAAAGALLRLDRKNRDAVAALIDGVMGQDADVRRSAGELLLQLRPRPKDADKAYAALLKPEYNVTLRLSAAEALLEAHRRSKEVLPVLIEIVKSPDRTSRQRSLEIMARLGSDAKAALPDLMGLIKSGPQSNDVDDAFVQIGPDAVPPLIEVLRENNSTAYSAAAILGQMGPEAGPTLIKLLDDSDAQIRSKALSVLGQNGPSAPGGLAAIVSVARDEKEARQHLLAVNGLSWAGPGAKAAVPVFLELVSQKDSSCKRAALDALFRFRLDADKVLPALNELVKDKDPSIRLGAATLRWRLDHKVGPALEIIKPQLTDLTTRFWAMKTLVVISAADEEGVPALVGCIEDSDAAMSWQTLSEIDLASVTPKLPATPLVKQLKSEDPNVRATAARVLARLGGDAKLVVPVLIDGLKGPSPNRVEQNLRALSRYGKEAASAAPKIKALLNGRNPFTAAEAARALFQINPEAKKEATDALLVLLADPETGPYKIYAAGALLQLDPLNPKAVAAFKDALSDPDPIIRSSAWGACSTTGPDAKVVLPLLETTLNEESGSSRLMAAQAFWKAGGRPDKAAAVLAESLKESPYALVRMNAAQMLGLMGADARTVVPALCDALKDRSLRVRDAAADSMRAIDLAAAEKAGIPPYPRNYP
jgi:HEAT repeat protein